MFHPGVSYPELPYPESSLVRKDRILVLPVEKTISVRRYSSSGKIPDRAIMMSWDMTRRASTGLMHRIKKALKSYEIEDGIYPHSMKVINILWDMGEKEDYLQWV